MNAVLSEIPSEIYVGDCFELEVFSTFPNNAMLKNISYQTANHVTTSISSNKVLDIVDGKLKGLAGGTCTLYVNVSTLQFVYEIEVKRFPETLVVYPSNIQTTKIQSNSVQLFFHMTQQTNLSSLKLQTQILPKLKTESFHSRKMELLKSLQNVLQMKVSHILSGLKKSTNRPHQSHQQTKMFLSKLAKN